METVFAIADGHPKDTLLLLMRESAQFHQAMMCFVFVLFCFQKDGLDLATPSLEQ